MVAIRLPEEGEVTVSGRGSTASAKQFVLELLETLPDDCSLRDIARRLYARDGVEEGVRDGEERRLDDLDEVMRQARMYQGG